MFVPLWDSVVARTAAGLVTPAIQCSLHSVNLEEARPEGQVGAYPGLAPQSRSSLSCSADSQIVPAVSPAPPSPPQRAVLKTPTGTLSRVPSFQGLNSDPHSSGMNSACLRAWGQANGPLGGWGSGLPPGKSSKAQQKSQDGGRSVAWGELETRGLQRQRTKGSWREGPGPSSCF